MRVLFQPSKMSPCSDFAGQPHVGLCLKFLVKVCFDIMCNVTMYISAATLFIPVSMLHFRAVYITNLVTVYASCL